MQNKNLLLVLWYCYAAHASLVEEGTVILKQIRQEAPAPVGETLEKLSSPARKGILLPAAQQTLDQVKKDAQAASAKISEQFNKTHQDILDNIMSLQRDVAIIGKAPTIDVAAKKAFENETQKVIVLYQQQHAAELTLAQAEDAYEEYDALARNLVNLNKNNKAAAMQIRNALLADPTAQVNQLIANVEKAAAGRNAIVQNIHDAEQQLAATKRKITIKTEEKKSPVIAEVQLKPRETEEFTAEQASAKQVREKALAQARTIRAITAKANETIKEFEALESKIAKKGKVKISNDQLHFNQTLNQGKQRIAAIQKQLEDLAKQAEDERKSVADELLQMPITNLSLTMQSLEKDLQVIAERSQQNILQKAFTAIQKLITALIEQIKLAKYETEIRLPGQGVTSTKKLRAQYPNEI